jgi:hypothetical protein
MEELNTPCWRMRPCAIVITKRYKHNFKLHNYKHLKIFDFYMTTKKFY